MSFLLLSAMIIIAVISFVISARPGGVNSFFKGWSQDDKVPHLITLTLSQVTTWIFARSLMTAAILGYYFGIVGGIAYAAYYLSFFTGAAIIDGVRFQHGFDNIQGFLEDRFGRYGVRCYNFVIALRLLSEVFANLLVIGIIFGETGSDAYIVAIVVLTLATLAYSMIGGLRASLKTDVFQMCVFAAVLVVIIFELTQADGWSVGAVLTSSPLKLESGWNLLLVALLQIWSYPLHDPVMMDRGFIADRRTTRLSFIHAGWISIVCILSFSLLGVYAGLNTADGEVMMTTLGRLLGEPVMTLISLALIISAVSTLDSTLSSAAKLSIVDMKLGRLSVGNGRIAMALFMLGGLAFLFGGSKDLYSAVAVSGTASMFLIPVVFFSIWAGLSIPRWSYFASFVTALGGAALYYVEAGGFYSLLEPALGISIKYNKLLLISLTVLILCISYFAIGLWLRRRAMSADFARP